MRSPSAFLAMLFAWVAAPASAQVVGDVLGGGSCDRPADIAPLSRQILATHLCRYPSDLESWSGTPRVTITPYYSSTVHPYARPAVVAALRGLSATILVNAGYRTVVQQYVMGRRAGRAGSGCYGRLAAPPGGTHAAGCAVDLNNARSVISQMNAVGFSWWGDRDPVHFSLRGCAGGDGSVSAVARNDVAAFQHLWNANNPSDRIPVSGNWDGTTIDRMHRSPIAGFARDGCAEDRDADGSPEGEDCDDRDASRYPRAPELCDARDNDCDPNVDEGVAQDCGSDVGECQIGRQTCAVGVWSPCAGEVASAPETCDTLDNDCDGEHDEERICEHEDAALARLAFGRQSTDLDGDGRADACFWRGERLECAMAAGYGFEGRVGGPSIALDMHDSLRVADLDGDGRDDVCAQDGDQFVCWRSQGDRFAEGRAVLHARDRSPGARGTELWLADVDGDGRLDLCTRDMDGLRCSVTASGHVTSLSALSDAAGFDDVGAHGSLRFGDVDGDGRDDVCARVEGGLTCWLADATGFGARIEGPRWDPAEGWDDPGRVSTWRLIDVEGDGRADACARGPEGFRCWHSDGRSFPRSSAGPLLPAGDGFDARARYATLRMGDLDGDGAMDLCARADEALRCWLWTGEGFTREVRGPALTDEDGWSLVSRYESLRMADVDGDGRADVCGRHGDHVLCWISTGIGFSRRWQIDGRDTSGLAVGGDSRSRSFRPSGSCTVGRTRTARLSATLVVGLAVLVRVRRRSRLRQLQIVGA